LRRRRVGGGAWGAPGAPHVSVYELGVRGAVPFVRAREGRTRRVVEISGRRGLEVEVAEGVDAAHQHGRRLVRHALVLRVGRDVADAETDPPSARPIRLRAVETQRV